MRPADRAWVVLAAVITCYEVAACRKGWELLSEAADRHRTRHPALIHTAAFYLAGHLTRKWPRRVDPLHRLTRIIRR